MENLNGHLILNFDTVTRGHGDVGNEQDWVNGGNGETVKYPKPETRDLTEGESI